MIHPPTSVRVGRVQPGFFWFQNSKPFHLATGQGGSRRGRQWGRMCEQVTRAVLTADINTQVLTIWEPQILNYKTSHDAWCPLSPALQGLNGLTSITGLPTWSAHLHRWSVLMSCFCVAKMTLTPSPSISSRWCVFPPTQAMAIDLDTECLLSEHTTLPIQQHECPLCNILGSVQKCSFSP